MTRLLIALIRAYQRWISPHLGHHCRFVPTCSEYAAQALATHGALKGGLLALFIRDSSFCGGRSSSRRRKNGAPLYSFFIRFSCPSPCAGRTFDKINLSSGRRRDGMERLWVFSHLSWDR